MIRGLFRNHDGMATKNHHLAQMPQTTRDTRGCQGKGESCGILFSSPCRFRAILGHTVGLLSPTMARPWMHWGPAGEA
jgi:hypothetical protein